MKCINHPSAQATESCSICGTPLCEACSIKTDDDKIICDQCSAAQAARDASGDIEQHIQKRLEAQLAQDKEKKGKKKRFFIGLALFSALVLAGNGYLFYQQQNILMPEENTPFDRLVFAATDIDEAIQDYMEEHGGKVPDSLDTLMNTGILQAIDQVELAHIYYTQLSPTQYSLVIRDNDSSLFFSGEER